MNITFKEKSLWVQIITLSLVFGNYFLNIDYKVTDTFPPNFRLSIHLVNCITYSIKYSRPHFYCRV